MSTSLRVAQLAALVATSGGRRLLQRPEPVVPPLGRRTASARQECRSRSRRCARTAAARGDLICKDTETACGDWAKKGECEKNPGSMLKLCPTSCGLCMPTCRDLHGNCESWMHSGACGENPGFMLKTCPVSCGVCRDSCADTHNDCPGWASDGQCFENPGYTLKTCPNSCQVCEATICEDKNATQCAIWGEGGVQRQPRRRAPRLPEDVRRVHRRVLRQGGGVPGLGRQGRVREEPASMLSLCAASCGTCQELEGAQGGAVIAATLRRPYSLGTRLKILSTSPARAASARTASVAPDGERGRGAAAASIAASSAPSGPPRDRWLELSRPGSAAPSAAARAAASTTSAAASSMRSLIAAAAAAAAGSPPPAAQSAQIAPSVRVRSASSACEIISDGSCATLLSSLSGSQRRASATPTARRAASTNCGSGSGGASSRSSVVSIITEAERKRRARGAACAARGISAARAGGARRRARQLGAMQHTHVVHHRVEEMHLDRVTAAAQLEGRLGHRRVRAAARRLERRHL